MISCRATLAACVVLEELKEKEFSCDAPTARSFHGRHLTLVLHQYGPY